MLARQAPLGHGIFQARILEWVATPEDLPDPGIEPVSPALAGGFLTTSAIYMLPTPVFLPGESQGRGSLVGCHLWGLTESDTTEAT